MTQLSKDIRALLVDLGNKKDVKKFDQIQKNFKKTKNVKKRKKSSQL